MVVSEIRSLYFITTSPCSSSNQAPFATLYPSRVVCENETVLSLIKDPKLTLTKSYKLVGEPDKVKLPEARINTIIENGGICDVIIDGAELKFTTV